MSGSDEDESITKKDVVQRLEKFRGHSESDKHWVHRREFILRNKKEYKGKVLRDRLLSLSMVWANNVFLGCRYNAEVLDKVKEMAQGIEVEDAPVFVTRDDIMKRKQNK
ncbi:CDKN2AIP N-terminal-like protein [Syngnathus scovelli]|uniref:CDKN2AIP N-terminal-like protein n=1 Tax=Syngnathus scovelli TaxID=161590 RepID=UPI0021103673|nr:CDKN2AIP N-terminal-like protein [Syngnathus scovelli]